MQNTQMTLSVYKKIGAGGQGQSPAYSDHKIPVSPKVQIKNFFFGRLESGVLWANRRDISIDSLIDLYLSGICPC